MSERLGLEEEREFYEKNKASLLEKCKGSFVLIKGTRLVGGFPTAEAAYEAGLREFGLTPFFVRQVVDREAVGFVPVLFIGQNPHVGL